MRSRRREKETGANDEEEELSAWLEKTSSRRALGLGRKELDVLRALKADPEDALEPSSAESQLSYFQGATISDEVATVNAEVAVLRAELGLE